MSTCEIAIARGLDRAGFRTDPSPVRRERLDVSYEGLPLNSSHAGATAGLPPIHNDPFDRLPIARAIVEGIALLTAAILRYPGPIRRV